MKRLVSMLFIMLSAVSLFAQHNHRTGYFLDGYTYKHKINPAFGSEQGYFAIPVAGFTSASIETPIDFSCLFYPHGNDGKLVTFLSPSVSVEDVMKSVKSMNPLSLNTDLSVISFGFNTKNSFHTVDLSLKADGRANVPGSIFTWAKEASDVLDISDFGARADARLELSYGYSRAIMGNARFGFRVKMLAGLAKAQYMMDKLQLSADQDQWTVQSVGSGYFASPFPLVTEGADRHISGIECPQFDVILDNIVSAGSLGAALDLGFSIDIIKNLTLSASLTDIGFMKWNNAYILESPDKAWSYEGFDGIGNEEMDLKGQLEVFGEELMDLVYPMVISEGASKLDMLGMTAHIGAEYRMPFWKPLSVGALGTARIDGPYSWFEGRASLNFAFLKWLSFSGSFAYSTFGESYGAALNIHPKGMNLFVGIDSFKPLFNMTGHYIPVDSFNTNVTFGLNIAFGK